MTEELNPYTVLRETEIPWQAEEEVQHFGRCECYSDEFPFPDRNCQVCHGKPLGEDGPDLGLHPHGHPAAVYLPGQTAHLTGAQAQALLEAGSIAPAGADLIAELRVAEAV